MDSFSIPLHMEDLKIHTEGRFCVDDTSRPSLADLDHIQQSMGDVVEACARNDVFDPLYSLVGDFKHASDKEKSKGLDLICSILNGLFTELSDSNPRLTLARNGLKMYVTLLQWFISVATKEQQPKGGATKSNGSKKTVAKGSWNWDKLLENKALPAIAQAAELDLTTVWAPANVEESFLDLLVNTAIDLLEEPTTAKIAGVRSQAAILLAETHTHTSGHMVNKLVHVLHNHEHAPGALADIVYQASLHDAASTSLAGEVLREVGKDLKGHVGKSSAANIGVFIPELTCVMPREVLANVSVLLPCLESEHYQLRSGILMAFGHLVLSLSSPEMALPSPATNSEADDGQGASTAPAVAQVPSTGACSMERTRDSLVDELRVRFRDGNAFTRSKVCQAWAMLAAKDAIPQSILGQVALEAVERSTDRSSHVRKSALQLLKVLMDHNPFKDCMNSKIRAAEYKKQRELRETLDNEDETGAADLNDDHESPEELFAKEAFQFADCMEEAMRRLTHLLNSNIATDVLEVLQVFTIARQLRISGAEKALLKAMSLVWSNNANIKDALIDAYGHLYLDPDRLDYAEAQGKLRVYSLAVARQLTMLLNKIDLGDLTSMEHLMACFVKADMLPKSVTEALWDLAALRAPKVTMQESVHALVLITYAAQVCPEIVRGHVQILTSAALKDSHLLRLRWVFAALQCLNESAAVRKANKGKPALPKIKLVCSHAIFDRMVEICTQSPEPDNMSLWYAATEQALNAIYAISSDPQQLVTRILQHLIQDVASGADSDNAAAESSGEEAATKSSSQFRLSQVLFVAGHVALKQLVFMETAAAGVRRDNMKKEKKSSSGKTDIAEELGGADAAQLENNLEDMLSAGERDLVGQNTLLGRVVPIARAVAVNEAGNYTDPMLRASAVLALTKFMCVDSDFCDQNLRLLFSLLRSEKSPVVRTNIIVALGDLAFRFPNEVEPWWSSLYECLRDSDVCVRRHAVLVMSHLILNDMVKAKGPMSELAICTQDSDRRVSGASILFFQELARKGNAAPIYNHLPDVLSKLSVSEEVTEEKFRNILSFLLSFIEKEKQADTLVDKLCNRLQTTNDCKQWRDVTYCLNQLKISEKGFKKLVDSYKSYGDKVGDDEVYESLVGVGEKMKKFAGPETKAAADDYLAKLEESRAQALDDIKASNKARRLASKEMVDEPVAEDTTSTSPTPIQPSSPEQASKLSKVRSKPAKRAPKKQARRAKESEMSDSGSDVDLSDDSDMDEVIQEKENTPTNLKSKGLAKNRGALSRRRQVVVDDSDED